MLKHRKEQAALLREGRLRGQARKHRVVRGGSFDDNDRNVRCAIRNHNHDDRNDNIGFRVAVSTLFAPPEVRDGAQGSLGPRRRMAELVPGRVRHLPDRAHSNGPAPWAAWRGATYSRRAA
jgi:Sulfatase-modifying factor enzyme 1